jgi:hypothetical protein
MKRLQWLTTFLTITGAAVLLYAQNPVSISQVGTTPVGTTVPVSGTVTGNTANSTPWLFTGSGAAGTAASGVVTVQGITSMTPLLVTPAANSAVNVAQLAGTTTDTNSGTKSAGTLRVVLATDQPQLTNKLLVTPDANSAVNVAQMNGVTVTMGNGVAGTGVQRVAVASDNTAFAVNAQPTPVTSGGTTACFVSSAASTNSTSCKGSAGQIYHVELVNTTSTLYYLRLYNSSSAPTCSSATGFIRTIPIPHGTGAGAGISGDYAMGEAYGTGIGFCLTGGGSSTDNTNAATGVYVTVLYK